MHEAEQTTKELTHTLWTVWETCARTCSVLNGIPHGAPKKICNGRVSIGLCYQTWEYKAQVAEATLVAEIRMMLMKDI